MENKTLKQHIEQILKADERLWYLDDETKETELNQTLLIDLAEKYDAKVLSLLFADELCKEKFFVKVGENYIFKSNDFQFFLEQNKVDNSYTKYKNRIGLSDGKRFLKDNKEVVLNFPFKDGILAGGQSSEEGQDKYYKNVETGYQPVHSKRKEIFFNEVLAADEIDRLRDEKALVNWKRFDGDHNHAGNIKITRDQNGTIRENLIIKGNNYLALHSLKKQFTGKVKLIYIDPPYNTGNDGFKYNDNFNHSTWLTFMKNRLEVAKQLLRDDGVIFVQCDDNEQAYLKVLMDEVFGRENFIINFIWQKKYSPSNDAKWFSDNHDHILVFGKNKLNFNPNLEKRTEEMNKRYSNPDNDPRGEWKAGGFSVKTYSKDYDYPIETPSGKIVYPPKGSCWQTSKENFLNKVEENRIYFGKNNDSKPQIKQFLSEVQQGVVTKSIWLFNEVGHNQISRQEINKLFGDSIFLTPKPEALLQRIIEIATQKGDIVLDYHLGSGTTAAVAHKMGRQYIGIEQMDYIEDIAVERLKKVITGEQGGISKAVKWQGGGSFIYCELAKWNEQAKEHILACESLEELKTFFDEMVERYFLNYNLKLKEFQDKVLQEKEFINLPLQEQKQMFCMMLDLNQMYVNRSEMEDKKFGISEEDIKMTKLFYDKEKKQ